MMRLIKLQIAGVGGTQFLINLGIKEEIIMEIRMYLELNDKKKNQWYIYQYLRDAVKEGVP